MCVHLKAITPGEAGTSLQHALLPLSEWHCLLRGFSGCQCIHRQRLRERVCVNESGGGSTSGGGDDWSVQQLKHVFVPIFFVVCVCAGPWCWLCSSLPSFLLLCSRAHIQPHLCPAQCGVETCTAALSCCQLCCPADNWQTVLCSRQILLEGRCPAPCFIEPFRCTAPILLSCAAGNTNSTTCTAGSV